MSLIQRIVNRRVEDIINQGLRLGLTQAVGTGNWTVFGAEPERTIVVTGYVLSTNAASPVLVTLSYLSVDGNTATPFATGYIQAGQSISCQYTMGDERYGLPGESLVLTVGSTSGSVAYTVNARQIGEKVPLGYIERGGAPAHSFPPKGTTYGTPNFGWPCGGNSPQTLVIATTALPGALVGSSYSLPLFAQYGTPPYTWAVTYGTLPSGFSLSSGGILSGTASSPGSSLFTVTVTDSASASITQSLSLVSVASFGNLNAGRGESTFT